MSRGNLYHPLLRPSRRLHQHFDRAMCRWNLKHVGFPSFARPGDAAFSHTSDNGYSGVDVKSFTGGVDSLRFVNASGLQSPPYGTPSVPAPWEKLRCDGNSLVIGGCQACVRSDSLVSRRCSLQHPCNSVARAPDAQRTTSISSLTHTGSYPPLPDARRSVWRAGCLCVICRHHLQSRCVHKCPVLYNIEVSSHVQH